MDDKYKSIVKHRCAGKRCVCSSYEPQIPAGAEREYLRLTAAYMRLLKKEVQTTLPQIKTMYKAEISSRDADRQTRFDSGTGLMIAVESIFQLMSNNLTATVEAYGLRKRLEDIANINRRLTVKEWKRTIRATIGIDITEDYYLGDFYAEGLEAWVSSNVDLIKTIPQDTLAKMKELVYAGYAKGLNTKDMVAQIQRAYDISNRHAKLIARDQTAKLNGQIQQAQQTDAGVSRYRWSTSGDTRVRDSHKELEGQIFNWDTPPENSDGRACHPGEDYQCRCVAVPIFDMDTLNLPVEGTEFLNLKTTMNDIDITEVENHKYDIPINAGVSER